MDKLNELQKMEAREIARDVVISEIKDDVKSIRCSLEKVTDRSADMMTIINQHNHSLYGTNGNGSGIIKTVSDMSKRTDQDIASIRQKLWWIMGTLVVGIALIVITTIVTQ